MKRSEYTQHARCYITCYKVEKLGLREQERSSLVEVADRFSSQPTLSTNLRFLYPKIHRELNAQKAILPR